MAQETYLSRHLVSSEDWPDGQVEEVLKLAKDMKEGQEPSWAADILNNKAVFLLFNKASTRSRISFHAGVAELGGVPLTLNPEDQKLHPGEPWKELSETLVATGGAICVRLLPTSDVAYGKTEELLREMALISGDNGPPVVSMSHGRWHPCQGLYEMMTYMDALGGNVEGKRILIAWTKGDKAAPESPTQDTLAMTTRMGMKVTLCHPPGYELDPEVLKIAEKHADANPSGSFVLSDDLGIASQGQDIVYARHWGPPVQRGTFSRDRYSDWYCDERILGAARFIHPMPVSRGVEASADVVDGDRSLLKELIKNKHYLQKAVLALLVRMRAGADAV